MMKKENESSLYLIPQTTSTFVREFFAVTLLLIFQSRAEGVDFFNSGMVLFLVLIIVRMPYINSYAFIFEAMTMRSWDIKHVGVQHYDDPSQNGIQILFVLAAHVLGAVAAAALRVYHTVAFGVETIAPNIITPTFTVSADMLSQLGSTFGADQRLADLSFHNGSRTAQTPLLNGNLLEISGMALLLWYVIEEIVYVCLLCICYVHIWLATGVGADERRTPNPFSQRYWMQLFRISSLLCVIYTALERAFPTAHGSLHITLYRCQMQVWNPTTSYIDFDHNEHIVRVIGGLIGLGLARAYNSALVSTRRTNNNNQPDEWYYHLIWGIPSPGEDDGGGAVHDGNNDAAELLGGGEQGTIVCVVGRKQSFRANKPQSDFRLRLPSSLDHCK